MCPPLTRRRFLASLGGAVGLGTVGSTVYHAYTGPVDLVIVNYERSPFTLDVRLSDGSELVLEETYDVPASTPPEYYSEYSSEIPSSRGGEAGIIRDRVVGRAIRGTTYAVRASTEDGKHTLDRRGENTATVTCTGYVDLGEGPLMDELLLEFPVANTAGGIGLSANYCSSLYNPD